MSGGDDLKIIGRQSELFQDDISASETDLKSVISRSSFLIVGGAGTIGQAVVKEIFRRNPKVLHVVDISENNLVELVRSLRSTLGYISGDFKTFTIDAGSIEMKSFLSSGKRYDYVFNLSALKHVRSEKDPYTLMRMINVNIFNSVDVCRLACNQGTENYFCVSTDKAANPANMMGASKRIMEHFLYEERHAVNIKMARFANVAFSDGSLLHGFNQRFLETQPISAPNDVERYFVTKAESGKLCMMSGIYGNNMEIFFPKLSQDFHLTKFSDLAIRFIEAKGFIPFICESEDQARKDSAKLISKGKWPLYLFESDTTGEKPYEEFYTANERLDMHRYNDIGVITGHVTTSGDLEAFRSEIERFQEFGKWTKADILREFRKLLPEFEHEEKGKYLEEKM